MGVLTELESGRAVRRLVFADETWFYDKRTRERYVVEEWWVGVDARTAEGHHDGTHGEGRILWHQLGRDEPGWALAVYHDGFEALHDAGLMSLLREHADAKRPALRAVLFEAGWQDLTERIRSE